MAHTCSSNGVVSNGVSCGLLLRLQRNTAAGVKELRLPRLCRQSDGNDGSTSFNLGTHPSINSTTGRNATESEGETVSEKKVEDTPPPPPPPSSQNSISPLQLFYQSLSDLKKKRSASNGSGSGSGSSSSQSGSQIFDEFNWDLDLDNEEGNDEGSESTQHSFTSDSTTNIEEEEDADDSSWTSASSSSHSSSASPRSPSQHSREADPETFSHTASVERGSLWTGNRNGVQKRICVGQKPLVRPPKKRAKGQLVELPSIETVVKGKGDFPLPPPPSPLPYEITQDPLEGMSPKERKEKLRDIAVKRKRIMKACDALLRQHPECEMMFYFKSPSGRSFSRAKGPDSAHFLQYIKQKDRQKRKAQTAARQRVWYQNRKNKRQS